VHFLRTGAMGAAVTRPSLRPLFQEGRIEWKNSDRSCRENADPHPPLVMPRACEHPVRRGLSAQARLPLEYWIARPSRAMTAERIGAMPNPHGEGVRKRLLPTMRRLAGKNHEAHATLFEI
jgi:hypothetical protein